MVADPLRVRILETIVLEPRTTKQIAELLGEKPTRLYHHVDALAEAGLIRLVDTRPVRGTTEKYYQAVARSFRTDPGLFSRSDAGDDEARALADVATTVLSNVTEEVRVERLRQLNQLARIVAHEVKNPLAGILGCAQLGLRKAEPGSRQQDGRECRVIKEIVTG